MNGLKVSRLLSKIVNPTSPVLMGFRHFLQKDLEDSFRHSRDCDLFVVVVSSLVVSPANDMPKIALRSGGHLVIMNQGETPMDRSCHLRFKEKIGEVLPSAVAGVKELMKN